MTRTRVLLELVAADGRLDPEAWRLAHRDRTPVAVCSCGGPVYTDDDGPEYVVHFGVRWHSLRCSSCHSTSELPATRVLPTVEHRPSTARVAAAAALERRKLADHL